MSDLPPGWEWAIIDELRGHSPHALAIGPFGSNLRVSDYRSSGVPLIFVRHIRAGDFDGLDPKFIDERKAEELAAHRVQPGDVLVTKMGEPPGDATVYPERASAVLTADCIKLTPHDGINAKYLAYLIEAPQFRRSLQTITRGVAQRKVSLGRFRNLLMPIAPTDEQERIVTTIEEHFSRLESAVFGVQRSRQRSEVLEQGIIDSTWDPAWRTVPLARLLSEPLMNGRSVRTDPEGFPVLRLTSLRDRRVDLRERKGGSWSRADAERFLVREGDFFVSRGNGSLDLVGRGGLVDSKPDPVAFPDTLIRVRVGARDIDARFLGLAWDSTNVRRQIERAARTTAGIYKINQHSLREIEIPQPPLVEQSRVVERVETCVQRIENFRSSADACIRWSRTLRRSILAAAFSGQLASQDPADEPAATLLERIRAERAVAAPARRIHTSKASRTEWRSQWVPSDDEG